MVTNMNEVECYFESNTHIKKYKSVEDLFADDLLVSHLANSDIVIIETDEDTYIINMRKVYHVIVNDNRVAFYFGDKTITISKDGGAVWA